MPLVSAQTFRYSDQDTLPPTTFEALSMRSRMRPRFCGLPVSSTSRAITTDGSNAIMKANRKMPPKTPLMMQNMAPKGCSFISVVEANRSKEGAASAPREACLTQESDPTIGSASSSTVDLNQPFEV